MILYYLELNLPIKFFFSESFFQLGYQVHRYKLQEQVKTNLRIVFVIQLLRFRFADIQHMICFFCFFLPRT